MATETESDAEEQGTGRPVTGLTRSDPKMG